MNVNQYFIVFVKFRHQMLTREVSQLEKESERAKTELREAREKGEQLQEQLGEAVREAEKAKEEKKKLRREFER